jgi:hypothetical protein
MSRRCDLAEVGATLNGALLTVLLAYLQPHPLRVKTAARWLLVMSIAVLGSAIELWFDGLFGLLRPMAAGAVLAICIVLTIRRTAIR